MLNSRLPEGSRESAKVPINANLAFVYGFKMWLYSFQQSKDKYKYFFGIIVL